MEDNMNRQLSCVIVRGTDSAVNLAAELVQHGFIHPQVSRKTSDPQVSTKNTWNRQPLDPLEDGG
jgi:hypothetical protein